jgi:predicted DNA-binding transcriptional regulator AlpA
MNATLREPGFRPTSPLPSPSVSPDIGLSEVAKLLNVSKSAATKYVRRPDFPEPRQLARMRVWSSDAVLEWKKKTLPLRAGRPPKA